MATGGHYGVLEREKQVRVLLSPAAAIVEVESSTSFPGKKSGGNFDVLPSEARIYKAIILQLQYKMSRVNKIDHCPRNLLLGRAIFVERSVKVPLAGSPDFTPIELGLLREGLASGTARGGGKGSCIVVVDEVEDDSEGAQVIVSSSSLATIGGSPNSDSDSASDIAWSSSSTSSSRDEGIAKSTSLSLEDAPC